MDPRSNIAARVTLGMRPQTALAVADVIRGAANVDEQKTQALGHVDGRTFSVPANTTQTFRIQWDQTFIIERWRPTSNHERDVEIKFSKPNEAGFLVGDSQNGVRVDTLATMDEMVELTTPWRLYPQEAFTIEITNTNAAPARINIAFAGLYVYGAR